MLTPKKLVQTAGILLIFIFNLKVSLNIIFFNSLTKSQCSKIVQDTFEKVRDEYVSKADTWKAVPDSAYDEETKQPAIVYGVYHLLRLLGDNLVLWLFNTFF